MDRPDGHGMAGNQKSLSGRKGSFRGHVMRILMGQPSRSPRNRNNILARAPVHQTKSNKDKFDQFRRSLVRESGEGGTSKPPKRAMPARPLLK